MRFKRRKIFYGWDKAGYFPYKVFEPNLLINDIFKRNRKNEFLE